MPICNVTTVKPKNYTVFYTLVGMFLNTLVLTMLNLSIPQLLLSALLYTGATVMLALEYHYRKVMPSITASVFILGGFVTNILSVVIIGIAKLMYACF